MMKKFNDGLSESSNFVAQNDGYKCTYARIDKTQVKLNSCSGH